jgi:hypothetical protein
MRLARVVRLRPARVVRLRPARVVRLRPARVVIPLRPASTGQTAPSSGIKNYFEKYSLHWLESRRFVGGGR